MGESKIEWTERTWNPIVGCSILTPGCTNCYAMKMAARLELMGNVHHYAGTTKKVKGNAVWTGKLALAPSNILLEPLKRRKPTTYFVNSMGDLFHEDCPDEWIDKVFSVMGGAEQHTFQVLTKRAARMRSYMTGGRAHKAWNARRLETEAFPPRNVWLGVSTERQQEADERIPHLLKTPAAVRFISAEPLLAPISLRWAKWDDWTDGNGQRRTRVDHLDGARMLDWVIVGGESGPNARPMQPDWVRSLRDQCADAGVPMFFKQWGEWAPYDRGHVDSSLLATPKSLDRPIQRFGKKLAGRLLDGREYNAMPRTAA